MGREIVLDLLARSASVAAVDIDDSALQETLKLAGDRKDKLATFVLNVADQEAVEALPSKVIARFGAVDGLINNAGIIRPFVRLKDLKFEAIQRVLDVNLYGTLYMVKAFLPGSSWMPSKRTATASWWDRMPRSWISFTG